MLLAEDFARYARKTPSEFAARGEVKYNEKSDRLLQHLAILPFFACFVNKKIEIWFLIISLFSTCDEKLIIFNIKIVFSNKKQ